MNAPKKRFTTPKTTIMKLFIEPGSRLPLHKPNPIPQRPTIVNTAMRIFSFFGCTYFSFNNQIRFWKLLNYDYLNILNQPFNEKIWCQCSSAWLEQLICNQ